MNREQRGLRFPFSAHAEVVVENSTESTPARVTELSLRGCFLETSSLPSKIHRLQIKIWNSEQFFEASADVLYVKATGVGLVFVDMKTDSRSVLQTWILAALDNQAKLEHT